MDNMLIFELSDQTIAFSKAFNNFLDKINSMITFSDANEKISFIQSELELIDKIKEVHQTNIKLLKEMDNK